MPSQRELNEKREALLALAASKVGYISREWRKAIQAVKDLATLEQLSTAILNNDYSTINALYSPLAIQSSLQPFKASLTASYVATGTTLAANTAQSTIQFNAVNPQLAQVVNNWTTSMITNETQATIDTINRVLSSATAQGVNPLESARQIRSTIGLTPQQQTAVRNYERALREGLNPTAYKLRDKRLDTKKPLSEEDIKKRVERYTEKQLKFRAETIARTEALRMTSMANQHIYENAIAEGTIRPDEYRKYWVATRDSRTRDAHRTLPSMNKEGRAINEPFISALGPILYPHDPQATAANTIRCRCVCIYDFNVEAFA